MTEALPQIKHTYQNHHLDSTRWEHFDVRDDDIVIATPYKSGTTWMQNIVRHLVFLGQDEMPGVGKASPWLDFRPRPLAEIMSELESQTHRRFVKTHTPLDGIPYYPEAKYIVVGRDPRDVFMSLWNHYRNYTPETIERFNENVPGRVGGAISPCPPDIGTFWYQWITRGWFDWEREGFPFWSNMGHVQSWWDYRDLPNIIFVHFADMLEDLGGEIARVAKFLGIEVTEGQLDGITEATTFGAMKQDADHLMLNAGASFKGGMQTFMNKGTNGRWKNVLVPEDLSLYQETAERILSPSCRQWLENGRLGHS